MKRARTMFAISLAVLVPFYVIPLLVRLVFVHFGTRWPVVLISDVPGVLATGFFSNNYRFAFLLYAALSVLEFLLLYSARQPNLAIFIGDAIPAVVTLYFAQRIYFSMGS